eukprot:m.148721 g.148721  ORF g.148721 m.148721 type:complete len:329 (-) comp17324_c0_seq3:796-1782(-)
MAADGGSGAVAHVAVGVAVDVDVGVAVAVDVDVDGDGDAVGSLGVGTARAGVAAGDAAVAVAAAVVAVAVVGHDAGSWLLAVAGASALERVSVLADDGCSLVDSCGHATTEVVAAATSVEEKREPHVDVGAVQAQRMAAAAVGKEGGVAELPSLEDDGDNGGAGGGGGGGAAEIGRAVERVPSGLRGLCEDMQTLATVERQPPEGAAAGVGFVVGADEGLLRPRQRPGTMVLGRPVQEHRAPCSAHHPVMLAGRQLCRTAHPRQALGCLQPWFVWVVDLGLGFWFWLWGLWLCFWLCLWCVCVCGVFVFGGVPGCACLCVCVSVCVCV